MRRSTGLARAAVYSASVAVVAWAALVVPLPFVEYVPGSPTEVLPLIEIEGAQTSQIDGTTALLTVTLRQQPTVPAVRAFVDPDRDLQRIEQVYPPGMERDEYLRVQRERFGRQFEVAAAVGARAAGVETRLVTEVVVVDIVDEGPSDGVLERQDVVVAVDGDRVTASEELQAAIIERAVGDVVTLTIRRGDELAELDVVLGEVPGQDGPRLGVAIHTAVDELRLPFDIRLADDIRIGGPSAGLIIGVTVYDLLSDEDLLRGRTVVATGSLDADGTVGGVGGVPEKMRAAQAYGADVVLVPHRQLDQALAAAPNLNIVGVRSIDEALDALRTR